MARWLPLIFFLCLSEMAWGQEADPKLDAIIQGCLQQPQRDKICDSLISLKIIGDDSIEAIKEYVELRPIHYYLLTLANYALTGRLRIHITIPRSPVKVVLDHRRDATEVILNADF